MNGNAPSAKSAWQAEESARGLVLLVFLVSFVPAGLGSLSVAVEALLGGLLGLVIATGLVHLWGERTRPKPSAAWVLVIAVWLVLLFIVSNRYIFGSPFLTGLLLLIAVVFTSRHDSAVSPSFLLLAGLWGCFFMSGRVVVDLRDRSLESGDAVWIVVCVIIVIAASTLEHERLGRRRGMGTPMSWTGVRLGFVALWSFFILVLREEVQWGRLFVLLGADLRGVGGQLFLLGVIAAGVALAAWALRPAKKRPS